MQIIIDIIGRAGGWRGRLHLRIENPPYIPLIIETLDESGPLGLPAVSVAHYTENFGNLMRHPEMHFELETGRGGELALTPYYWRNDFVAVEQTSRLSTEDGYIVLPDLYQRHVRFAVEWNEVLSRQCFALCSLQLGHAEE
jgi:hypothetical protein